MPKKKVKEPEECCETENGHECCCCHCPIGRIFCRCGHHEGREIEMPEFMDHFISARKEVLTGIREMLDWKIEKMEKKIAKRGSKRVKKVKIE